MSKSKSSFSDAQVIAALQSGIGVSEAVVYLQKYKSFCVGHLPHGLQADLWQEILMALVVWAQKPDFQLNCKLSTWLYATAYRMIQRHYRDEFMKVKHLARYAEELAQIEQNDTATYLDQKDVLQVFNLLSTEEQALLRSYELRGAKTVEQLATEMGISKNALVMRVERIKAKFFNLCQQHELI